MLYAVGAAAAQLFVVSLFAGDHIPQQGVIKAAYHLLGLKTYFTAGPDEVRAWTFKDGMSAPECAGIIHSDFQRGFIRAEAYCYEDLMVYGTEVALKENGKLRSEGKGCGNMGQEQSGHH